MYDIGSFSNGSFCTMYDKYRGWANVRSATETRRRTHLVEFDKLLPLVLSNVTAVLEFPNLNPISGENAGCHGGKGGG